MIETLESRRLFSLSNLYVATTGSDLAAGTIKNPFKTIQHALDVAATPGETIFVRAGTYHERLTFRHSGSSAGGSITLRNYANELVILDGRKASSNDVGFGQNIVQIINISYVKVVGFDIAYNSGTSVKDDAFGVRVQGSGTGVQILNNTIHDMTGKVVSTSDGLNFGYGGAGIHVYGSSTSTPYSKVVISGNTIFNCQPGDDSTETLTLNGNVNKFSIDHNVIYNCNNIGIDMIGGESDVFGKPDGTTNLPVARTGVCEDNTVYNIHANYGDGYAGAIYVDGGKNIVVQRNHVSFSDLGIEVGAETAGYVASGITVRDNIIDHNTQSGLVFGGYDASVGRVESCAFTNNTIFQNDTTHQGNGEVWIQYASNNLLEDNILFSDEQDLLIDSQITANNVSKYNLVYCDDGKSKAQFVWGGTSYSNFAGYQKGSGQDQKSVFGNPKLANPDAKDFHLTSQSPAIDAGDPVFVPAADETDFFGNLRLQHGRVDFGAVEH